MQQKLVSYKEYKNIETDWIEAVPRHWNITHLKRLCSKITDGAHTSPDLSSSDYPFLTVVNLTNGSLDFQNCLFTSRADYNILVRNGCKPQRYDVLYSKDGTISETAVIEENREFVVGSSFIILRPRVAIVFSKYLSLLLSSSIMRYQARLYVKGASLPRISIFNISKLIMVVPPLLEQRTIADYLDIRSTKIDRKIDLLTQKAAQYAELKQSLINNTVTKGLEKSVKMIDSGVERIGSIVGHWEIKRLKDVISVVESGSREKGGASDAGVFSLSAEHINWNGEFDFSNAKYVSCEHYKKMTSGKLHVGDILLTKDGATIGKCAYFDQAYFPEMSINEHMYLMRKNRKTESKFLYYLIASPMGCMQIRKTMKTSAIPGISSGFTMDVFFPIPPINEQRTIVEYLDAKTAKIDQIIETINSQIDKLKELRKTLINDVVTGKIKVAGEVESA